MKCPGCGEKVDADQDFCMECGEPIAQSPVVDVPSLPAKAPLPAKPPLAQPSKVPSFAATTLPGKASVRKRVEEPEKIRCPGCGVPSLKARCPGCGARLRDDDV
jgi:predicted amidophosphoribosyltransferase